MKREFSGHPRFGTLENLDFSTHKTYTVLYIGSKDLSDIQHARIRFVMYWHNCIYTYVVRFELYAWTIKKRVSHGRTHTHNINLYAYNIMYRYIYLYIMSNGLRVVILVTIYPIKFYRNVRATQYAYTSTNEYNNLNTKQSTVFGRVSFFFACHRIPNCRAFFDFFFTNDIDILRSTCTTTKNMQCSWSCTTCTAV